MIDFEKVGIKAAPYKKGPQGANIFILGLNPQRNQLRFWLPKEGTLIENVSLSKKHRQATFTVIEEKRQLESREMEYHGSMSTAQWSLRGRLGINLPESARYTVVYLKEATLYGKGTYKIVANVPKSTQHFLVGYDEDHLFISQLPKAATSVEDAHKILLPDGANLKSKRQGEWFFLPSDVDEDILNKSYESYAARNYYSIELTSIKRSWGNHRASMISRYKNNTYVRGLIFDTTHRHKSFLLPNWMRAVKNKEIENYNSTNWD